VGYVFRPRAPGPRPAIILNNGSDGPVNAMWAQGAAGAVERGYVALTFDGPGEGEALFEQGLPFRPDWEAVITPVVDVLAARDDVDPSRIALQGISQGGYWAPRAAAFEKRISAVIADPGVMDVSTSWTAHLPKSMVKALDEGRADRFDRELALGMRFSARGRRELAFRSRPYGSEDPYEVFRAVREYHLRDVAGRIECPVLITDPDDEQFWPGQSAQLRDALSAPATLVRFTAEEGANWHCEPKARGLYDQRMFDWLATVMPAR
jgi:alpha-beta hydrolase superfamily lysophospholipase